MSQFKVGKTSELLEYLQNNLHLHYSKETCYAIMSCYAILTLGFTTIITILVLEY